MSGTRYSPLDRINASNFDSLEVAWIWRSDNFGPSIDQRNQNTPIYVDGKLYGIAGNRRNVVSIDPATGETLWTYREPHTARYQASTRKDWGKGIAYATKTRRSRPGCSIVSWM
jgi:quinoprotein glucose dehydrogenase